MSMGMILLVQVFVWMILLLEWKWLKQSSKKEKVTLALILGLCVLLSFLNVEQLPGLVTLLETTFRPINHFMQ